MNDQKPRVSLGLPVYNAEKYLEQALDSILSQTYSDFELIISDNASTDRTQEICQTYAAKDNRIGYYRNDQNLGAAPNFNRVFKLSSGEYFKWAPYDDKIGPEFLSRCVEILDQNPTVVVCYSKAKIIDERGEFVGDYDPGPDTSSPKPHERFRNLMLHPEYAIQQMGLTRSDVMKRTSLMGSFPSSDEVYLAELALLGEYYEIPDRLYLYRRHAEQSTIGKERTRVLFFDTNLKGKIVLPKWQYLLASLAAINRAPINWFERMKCYGHMIRWTLVPPHFRALGKDILLAAQQWIVRTFRVSIPGLQQVR